VGTALFHYLVSDGQTTSTGNVSVEVVNPYQWNNFSDKYDVNNDGSVSSIDALVIINLLNTIGGTSLTGALDYVHPTTFYDVSRDNYVSSVDALLVINDLNSTRTAMLGAGEGESAAPANSAAVDAVFSSTSQQSLLQDIVLPGGRRRVL
jgi:hypothetical protein